MWKIRLSDTKCCILKYSCGQGNLFLAVRVHSLCLYILGTAHTKYDLVFYKFKEVKNTFQQFKVKWYCANNTAHTVLCFANALRQSWHCHAHIREKETPRWAELPQAQPEQNSQPREGQRWCRDNGAQPTGHCRLCRELSQLSSSSTEFSTISTKQSSD